MIYKESLIRPTVIPKELIPQMKRSDGDVIRYDLVRYGAGKGAFALARALKDIPGFCYTFFMRKVACHRDGKGIVSRLAYPLFLLILRRYRYKYGIDISPAAEVGPGLYIGHFGGIVVSPFAKIGANVNINQGVTIGTINRGPRAGTPVIGDRVWIGANAIVVGHISIGDDSLIGPGAFVNFNVPAQSIVIGNPGKVVSHKGSADYINNLADLPCSKTEKVTAGS